MLYYQSYVARGRVVAGGQSERAGPERRVEQRPGCLAIGGGGTLLRWDGRRAGAPSAAGPRPTCAPSGAVVDDVWAVGDAGTILRWTGSAWRTVPGVGTESLRSLWGRDASDVWAVGDAGTILHWSSAGWGARHKRCHPAVAGQAASAMSGPSGMRESSCTGMAQAGRQAAAASTWACAAFAAARAMSGRSARWGPSRFKEAGWSAVPAERPLR